MRVCIVGNSGAGKSTLARRLAAAIDAPHVELDAINWQAGWVDLNTHDPEEFLRRTYAALSGPSWVTDGNYSRVAEATARGRPTWSGWTIPRP
ncbi:AAA family ATPase [Phenylobacterium aquaticum]|uniref:AAA family ATPase n=1 Tax=Phenylobacterium aquaticum TaxID=1763816 RepID=UPI001F5E3370|nr:AAA family ATPase [Phenylobacterium aquaticum]MCI3134386.1 AAA family ATPase [Phenylobacterium aquaticum]